MTKKNTRTVGVKLKLSELAKARDGLIARGVNGQNLQSGSQILRTALLYAVLNCKNPKGPASEESTRLIKQLWKQA